MRKDTFYFDKMKDYRKGKFPADFTQSDKVEMLDEIKNIWRTGVAHNISNPKVFREFEKAGLFSKKTREGWNVAIDSKNMAVRTILEDGTILSYEASKKLEASNRGTGSTSTSNT